jgi:HEAT repeat protein
LIKALEDQDPAIRHAAAYALGEIGPDAESAIPALIQSLSDKNEQVRDSSRNSLSTIGGPAIIALFDASAHGSETVRKAAAAALEKLDSLAPGTTPPLIKMAQGGAPARRCEAIETLGSFRARSRLAITAMTGLLADPLPEIRLAAVRFLNQAGPKAHTAVPALERLAEDPEEPVRTAAKELLARIGN